MYMNSVNRVGFVHREMGTGSQDFVSGVSRRGVNAMCLCDGAGSYLYTALGARTLSARLAGFMSDQFYNLSRMEDQAVKQLVVAEIHRCIQRLRHEHGCCAENAYASTAICCAMEAASGEYIAIHLGDGFLAEVRYDSVHRLTLPREYDKGDRARATMLSTGSADAMLADIQVVRGNAEGILMTSDGAEGRLYERFGNAKSAAQLLVDGVKKVGPACADVLLERTATSFHAMDDVSVGLMLRGRYPTPESMGYTYGVLPHRQSMHVKRVMKAFCEYAVNRDAGLDPERAARHAGWGSRSSSLKCAFCRNNLRVY